MWSKLAICLNVWFKKFMNVFFFPRLSVLLHFRTSMKNTKLKLQGRTILLVIIIQKYSILMVLKRKLSDYID